MNEHKWPKTFSELTPEQKQINDDFVKFWHEKLSTHKRYSLIEKFNHNYSVKNSPENFVTTLEIGAGLGEHFAYEKLTPIQKQNYVALELRENMACKIKDRYPDIITHVGDCQSRLNFADGFFDRILAIHVLEHLPNLPAAVAEMHRLCNKEKGIFSVVIPCEGGALYTLGRKLSAQRLFKKRYQQSYQWFIEREHVSKPSEIQEELEKFFKITHRQFFPFLLPKVNINLCIGLTMVPRDLQNCHE